jgi:tetratricopeptide (TPR) repeat protein
LRAKGFTTAPALIGVGITPVPEVPSPALFNHVITIVDLPSGRIWLDTTPEVAPYRVLIPLIRDQLALVVPATEPARLERTPADPPFPYFERFEAVATLDKDGLLKGHMDWTLRSDNELVFRALLQQAAPAQWNSALQNVSQAVGFQGTVSNADLKQKDSAGPVHVSYDYTRPSYADWDHHRILPLFPALEIAVIDKDKAPDHDIELGAPRTLEAITRIQLPAGYTPNLPSLVHVDRSFTTYDQTYRLDKDQLIIERKVVMRKNKVPKSDWKDYYAFTRDIGAEHEEPYIALTSPGHENGEQTVMATAASEALSKAGVEMDRGQWEVAQQTLNQVKATAPDTPYLMSMLGGLAQRNGHSDEAIRDYEAEVTHHPDAATRIVTQLANLYLAQKRYQDEEALLRKYTDRNDDYIYSMLVNAQIRSGDDAGALTTLQGIMATHPNDRSFDGMLAGLLHKAHRDPEAIAIARTWLAANDAKTINSGAYLLSEMNLELPLAEVNSRRAIRMMEADSARVTLHDTNDMPFFDTDVLAFAWNTLGWVLYQEGKPAEAEPYLRAAWFSRTDMAVANKLAQVLEAQDMKADALAMNQVALVAADASGDVDNVAAVRRNIERLRQAGVTTSLGDPHQALEAIHTFSIANSGALEGSAAFKISIAGDHIEQAILVEGPAGFETLIPQLSKVNLPGAVPPDSKARLFRGGDLYCASTTSPCELRLIPRVNPAAARPYVKPKESVAAN